MNEKKLARYGALYGAVFGVTGTAIYDWVKAKPVFSTIHHVLNSIWEGIFEYKIPIWQITIIVIIIFSFKKLTKIEKVKLPKFLDYTEDIFDGTSWEWSWKWDSFEEIYLINNLVPLCKECKTPLELYYNSYENIGECPRCDNKIKVKKSTEKIKRIISDNLNKALKK